MENVGPEGNENERLVDLKNFRDSFDKINKKLDITFDGSAEFGKYELEYSIKRSNVYTNLEGMENYSNILRVPMNYSGTFDVAETGEGNCIFLKFIVRKNAAMIKCIAECYVSYNLETEAYSWIINRHRSIFGPKKFTIDEMFETIDNISNSF